MDRIRRPPDAGGKRVGRNRVAAGSGDRGLVAVEEVARPAHQVDAIEQRIRQGGLPRFYGVTLPWPQIHGAAAALERGQAPLPDSLLDCVDVVCRRSARFYAYGS